MKFYFFSNSTNIKEYSTRLITRVMQEWMVDDPSLADYVMVSMCDITEIGDIDKARKLGKPILSGGMISEYPLVNELSDYTYHGEIYGLRDHLLSGGGVDDCEFVTTKLNKRLRISQEIKWSDNPIIGVGNRAKYYYVSKGCPVRCKYCYIGNARDYQVVPRELYDSALAIAKKGLMPIAAYNPYGVPTSANVGETLLKKYIAGHGGDCAKMLRSGVEFVTPQLSKSLAKGVTIDDLNAALDKSKRNKTKLILYFIAGLETQEHTENYFSDLVADFASNPAVNLVFTYIDPQPFTPMHDFDISKKIAIDTKRVYGVASQRNKRIRILPLAAMSKSTNRTLLGRCESIEDYHLVKSISKLSHEEMLSRVPSRMIGSATINDICDRQRAQTLPDYWKA